MPNPDATIANLTFKLSAETTARLDRFIDRMTVTTVLGVQRPSRVGVARKALDMFLDQYAETAPAPALLAAGEGEGAGEGAPAAETAGDDADATAAAEGEAGTEQGAKPLL